MKRALATIGVFAVAALVVFVVVGVGGSSDSYKVAAIFDSAKGMVAGQQVKIAGAVVGSVDAVELAPGPKARLVMDVQRKFAPFHAGATCSILPEGLISENYVQCVPGDSGPPLPKAAGGIPTVAVEHTTVPVSVQDVLNTFSLPTDQRLGVFLSEMGVATTGRGADLNGLFARSNPALAQSERVLSIVNAQRHQLANAVGQTDDVTSQLADNNQSVRTFVDRAATVATTTADHSGALGDAVHHLPPMLDAIRPGLRSLDTAAANAEPLLVDLQQSAPGLNQLTNEFPLFTAAGLPALRELSSAAQQGRPALRAALPVVKDLAKVSTPLVQTANGAEQLVVSMRQTGAMEGFLHLFYILATIGSLYDSTSHILTFTAAVAPLCIANEHTTVDVPGCSHKYNAPGQGSLPVNDPACGPVVGDWENKFCPGGDLQTLPPGGGILIRRGHAATTDVAPSGMPIPAAVQAHPGAQKPGSLKSLLSYLIR